VKYSTNPGVSLALREFIPRENRFKRDRVQRIARQMDMACEFADSFDVRERPDRAEKE